jgi:DNA-binding beta-propeller fold protein YncE
MGQTLIRVDIAARAVGPAIGVPWYLGPVAISSDGGLAVVVATYSNAIGLVDLTRARPSPTTIPVGNTPRDVQIAKDGSSVVVVCERSTDVVVL